MSSFINFLLVYRVVLYNKIEIVVAEGQSLHSRPHSLYDTSFNNYGFFVQLFFVVFLFYFVFIYSFVFLQVFFDRIPVINFSLILSFKAKFVVVIIWAFVVFLLISSIFIYLFIYFFCERTVKSQANFLISYSFIKIMPEVNNQDLLCYMVGVN